MIFFNDILNTVSGFWHLLAPFINIINGVTINSFISDNINIIFNKIIKLWEFIIKISVAGLIITSSSFIYNDPINIRFNKIGTT